MAIFEYGGALNPEEHHNIIVQRSELGHILAHIQSEDLYVILRSPRQTGKTTLLFQIQAYLQALGYGVVYLDLSGLSDLGKPQFYQKICADICDGLMGLVDSSSEFALSPQQVTDQMAFSKYLTWFSSHTAQSRRLVLMLDEVGGVPEAMAFSFFQSLRSFFHNGRRQSKERDLYRKILFIFAGALDVQMLMKGGNSPLRNICNTFSLNDFSQEQVHSLASNLEGFLPKAIGTVADVVYGWCCGHPYLTQRLFALIESSQEYNIMKADQFPEVMNRLVETHFLYGDDVNIASISSYLRESKEYRNQVFKILRGEKRKSVLLAEDLLSIGVIKRSDTLDLIIRNKIYENKLKNFFKEEESEN